MKSFGVISLLLVVLDATTAQESQTDFQCQSDDDCLNSGVCINNVPNEENYCRCPFGFGGENCASACDRQCHNGGSCRFHKEEGSGQEGDTYCECPPHQYLGVHCEIPYVLCPGPQEMKCLWGGTCPRTAREYQCQCPEPRTGKICEFASAEEEEKVKEQEATMEKLIKQTDASSASSSSGSSYADNTKMAGMLLGLVLVLAGLLTVIAMYWFRPKTSTTGSAFLEEERKGVTNSNGVFS